jgi:hypothetical protein
MRGHHLRLFKRAVVQEIRRDAGSAEGMATDGYKSTSEKLASVKDSEYSESRLKLYNYADKENSYVD